MNAVQESVTTTTVPFVSVIVPVRNEGACIADTLTQLFDQNYPTDRFEVLVADGESTDDTPVIVQAMATEHANLRLLPNPGRWSSAGRNVATRAARGDIVLLIDGHCEIRNRQYLRDLVDAFARSGADCVGRPQPLDVFGASKWQRAIAAARSSRFGHHPDSHIYSDREGMVPPDSVAIAYRREVFDRVGYFDESFDACEDYEFNHRCAQAGLTCFFTPRATVRYQPRNSPVRLYRQMVRYGRGRIRLLRKHRDTLSLGSLIPAAFVAGLVVGPLLAMLWSPLWLVYFGVVGLYLMLLAMFSFAAARKEGDLGLIPHLAVVFPAVHLGAGVGAWQEILAPQRGPGQVEDRGPVLLPIRPQVKQKPIQSQVLNALTIDVEDYFHVSAFEGCVDRGRWDSLESRVALSTDKILDMLAAQNVRGTFFILGWVAERLPNLVRIIQSAGHEIGCHSYAHRLIYTQTPEEFREDLRRGLGILQDILGERVTAYRAPSFSITAKSLWALDILLEEGITLDSSIYPTHHDRYGIPGTPLGPHPIERPAGQLWEFPPPVCRLLGYPMPVGGGGYFRLYPYALTRLGLRRINAEGRPFSTYLHPWELDPTQPRFRPGLMRSFRHYVNLRRTEPRLEQLLKDFRFGTLSEALASFASVSVKVSPQQRAA